MRIPQPARTAISSEPAKYRPDRHVEDVQGPIGTVAASRGDQPPDAVAQAVTVEKDGEDHRHRGDRRGEAAQCGAEGVDQRCVLGAQLARQLLHPLLDVLRHLGLDQPIADEREVADALHQLRGVVGEVAGLPRRDRGDEEGDGHDRRGRGEGDGQHGGPPPTEQPLHPAHDRLEGQGEQEAEHDPGQRVPRRARGAEERDRGHERDGRAHRRPPVEVDRQHPPLAVVGRRCRVLTVHRDSRARYVTRPNGRSPRGRWRHSARRSSSSATCELGGRPECGHGREPLRQQRGVAPGRRGLGRFGVRQLDEPLARLRHLVLDGAERGQRRPAQAEDLAHRAVGDVEVERGPDGRRGEGPHRRADQRVGGLPVAGLAELHGDRQPPRPVRGRGQRARRPSPSG